MEHLADNKILYRHQSGFRKYHSSDTCLSYLTDKILTGFDSGLLTGMILIDLQKALDTINHNILLKKYLRLDFLLNQLHGLDRTSLIEDFKSTSKISTPMLLTSTVEYHKDLS